jgi:hypothetical protein
MMSDCICPLEQKDAQRQKLIIMSLSMHMWRRDEVQLAFQSDVATHIKLFMARYRIRFAATATKVIMPVCTVPKFFFSSVQEIPL